MNRAPMRMDSPRTPSLEPRVIAEDDCSVSIVINLDKATLKKHRALLAYLHTLACDEA